MPLYMDVHRGITGIDADALRLAHLQDLQAQEEFGVQYHKYFFNEEAGTVYCLVEGPDAETCQQVHRASHGLVPDDMIEVQPDLVDAFFATTRYDDVGAAVTMDGRPDAGLRVILFTQIANFTALSREHDAAAAALLECHDGEVRGVLARNRGTEVRHTGEGIMACFPSASTALDAAVEIQRRCTEHGHDGPDQRPILRIGLSAGEPVSKDRDLFGAVVNTARRICEAAEPGQILVSGALRELGLGKSHRFQAAGRRILKDVDEPLDLYTVPWTQERSATIEPPLRSLGRTLTTFWEELTRRRVVRVAVAYSIAFFIVLQVAELTLGPLGLPSWSYTLVLVAGLLGMPLVIALAWAFDITPSGLQRTPPASD